MKLINVVFDDFVNYKLPSMTLEFPYCTFKCNSECNQVVCHNTYLKDSELIDVDIDDIINMYLNNNICKSIVMQGLEPFDSFNELIDFVHEFRKVSKDTIVIYTGYVKYEILDKIRKLQPYGNIILKLGRYMPGCDPHFDNVLGVKLASDNQHAEYIEKF